MSAENVALVHRFFDAMRRRDREAMDEIVAEDVEWLPSGLLVEDPDAYRGRDEVWSYLLLLDELFADARREPEEITPLGDRTLIDVRIHREVSTNADWVDPFELRFISLASFRDGRLARIQNFTDRDDALRAAGLDQA